jgi:chromosomal replication initiator protein
MTGNISHHTGSPLLDHLAAQRDRIHATWFGGASLPAPRPVIQSTISRPRAPHNDDRTGTSSPLNPRLTFANFMVGSSNQLAYAHAQGIVGAGPADPLLYNPLYLCSSIGLGKTHLLQAIAHAADSAKQRVIYFTAERFICEFSRKKQLQELLRGIEIILLDDIHLLVGKSKNGKLSRVHCEFCYILDYFLERDRQIVIAADRPPNCLESLEERARSRLVGGLCIKIGSPDEELRIKILEARIAGARLKWPVSADIVAYVATNAVRTNGRDLAGAVHRLVAYEPPCGHSLESAKIAMRDLVLPPKHVKIEDIQELVANHFNVTRGQILSVRRTGGIVRPRLIAMYLADLLTLRTLSEIGRMFGGRDHTTVLYAVRRVNDWINGTNTANKRRPRPPAAPDVALGEEIETLKRKLLS